MISIVIPVYNRQAYIEECIRSVQVQTYQNYEILLIDDGSTDDTLTICRRLAQEIPQIRILESGHVDVSAARNLGLDAACGDYVFFLDSDDVIHPGLLEVLVTGLKNSDAAMAGTEICNPPRQYWEKAKQMIADDIDFGETRYHSFEETIDAVFCGKSPFSKIGGVMMRRELIGDTRFRTELHIGEDFMFVYENLIKGVSTVWLKQKWYFGRTHTSNLSKDVSYAGFMSRLIRRQLVWESEERAGRFHNATKQKNAVLTIYRKCAGKKVTPKDERRKMTETMRAYGKTLFPAFGFANKIRYLWYVWVPGGLKVALFVEKLIKKRRK